VTSWKAIRPLIPLVSSQGNEVAPFSVARRSAEHGRSALISLRSFGCGWAALNSVCLAEMAGRLRELAVALPRLWQIIADCEGLAAEIVPGHAEVARESGLIMRRAATRLPLADVNIAAAVSRAAMLVHRDLRITFSAASLVPRLGENCGNARVAGLIPGFGSARRRGFRVGWMGICCTLTLCFGWRILSDLFFPGHGLCAAHYGQIKAEKICYWNQKR